MPIPLRFLQPKDEPLLYVPQDGLPSPLPYFPPPSHPNRRVLPPSNAMGQYDIDMFGLDVLEAWIQEQLLDASEG